MQHLFEKLREDTRNWRNEGYPCPDYPLIGEVLRYQFEGEPPEQISLKREVLLTSSSRTLRKSRCGQM